MVQGYCVRCREQRELLAPRPVFLGDSARPATQGECAVCGTKIVRFGQTAAHDGLTPPTPPPPPEAGAKKAARSRPKQGGPGPGKAERGLDAPEGGAPKKAEQALGGRGSKLVIVESPAKARTIGRFLGRGYAVEPSVGHIRDLPANRMGVDIEHDFAPHYVIPEKKKEVVKKLQGRAQQAAEVYLATDPDREGEAIAWHLAAALERQLRDRPVHRVEFHEITREAIDQAFAQPRQIDQARVDSQQARRILDRVVGYTLSPLLRDKVGRKGLSAGRVQSVALRLICEREREIQAFVPVEYWSIEAELRKRPPHPDRLSAQSFVARLVRVRGQEPVLGSGAEAQTIVDDLQGAEYQIEKVTQREIRRNPPPPFMTSTMQQEASRRLGMAPRQTMAVAQALYEGKEVGGESVGLITYMRTDSVQVAGSAQAEAREYIREQFGADYVPARPPQYKTRAKAAQEAHEAIRPTAVRRTPESLQRYLSKDELRLYTLIWRRFVASQMAAAILDQTTVDILAGQPDREKPYLFRATGTVVKFPGFLEVYQEKREAGEAAGDERGAGASGGGEESDGEGEGVRLPPLEKGEILDLIRLLPKQHFTQPPPRYTEASLIRALEEYGIGRPSTYAPILTTLVQRAYVERVDKKLAPTQLGFVINDLLVASFPEVINVTYTAEMEEQLDLIANGDRGWVATLQALYAPFAAAVEVAREEMPQVELKPQPTGEQCPQCGSPLVFRQGRNGRFVGCSGWPTCRYTASIPVPGAACPKCGGPILERRARGGRRFYGCANYPACDWAGSRPPKPQAHPEGTLAGQNQEA